MYNYTSKACVKYEQFFFQPESQILLRKNVFILKLAILINNKLLSTANAKDINTDYYIKIGLKLQGIMDL